MRVSVIVVAALACAAASGAALAATVTTIEGNISINRGSGFKPVTGGGTGAASGDKVMAGKNSTGQIVYENGYVVEVKAGEVVTVQAQPPSQAGALALGGDAVVPVVAGVAVAGGVIAAVAASNDDGDSPASP